MGQVRIMISYWVLNLEWWDIIFIWITQRPNSRNIPSSGHSELNGIYGWPGLAFFSRVAKLSEFDEYWDLSLSKTKQTKMKAFRRFELQCLWSTPNILSIFFFQSHIYSNRCLIVCARRLRTVLYFVWLATKVPFFFSFFFWSLCTTQPMSCC